MLGVNVGMLFTMSVRPQTPRLIQLGGEGERGMGMGIGMGERVWRGCVGGDDFHGVMG